MSGYRKDEYSWRYDGNELPEDVIRASTALENLQLDRKARNLTSSWRFVLTLNNQIYYLLVKNDLLLCAYMCLYMTSFSLS